MVTDSPALAFVLRGPQHTVEIMNPSFLSLIDKRVDDVVGRPFAQALPEQAAHYVSTFDRVFATGEPFAGHEIVAHVETPDGERVERYLNFLVVPLRSASGVIEGVLSFGFEVTEPTSDRQKSLDLERRYRFTLDALPTLAWTTDGERMDYVNRRWGEYSGHEVSDPSLIDWNTFVHPEDQHVLVAFDAGSSEPWSAECRLRRHDGVYRWFLGRSVAFVDSDGRTTRRFGTATEIHEQKEAASRQCALAAVTAHIADAQSPRQVAQAACSEGRSALDASSAIMWKRDADGTLRMLASDGVPDESIERYARIPPDRVAALRARVEAQEGVWIELSAGTVVLSFTPLHPFSEPEVQFIRTLGAHVAQALDRARALDAERRASARIALLATSGEVLTASLDFRETLRNLSRVVVPGFADWCAIDLVLHHELERVAVHHADPEQVKLAFELKRRYPDRRSDGSSTNRVIDTMETVWVAHVTDAMLRNGARDAEHYELLSGLGIASVIQVPLVVDGRTIGVVSFVNDADRPYDETDRAFAEELGRRAAGAIANALLFTREHDARQALRSANERLALLARAGESLSSSIDYDRTLDNVVATAMPMLADFCFFDVLEGNTVRRIPGAYEDPATLALLSESRTSGPRRADATALTTGETGFHPDIDDAWRACVVDGPDSLDVLRQVELCSMVTVPLRSGNELRGALTLCFGRSGRHHVSDDVTLAEELARRAAVAVEQARLFRDARDAARRAEEANRIKDDFLATVSHELRTPLNAIMGWSSMLRGDAQHHAALEKGLDVIHRNAVSQARIINDILDVSRIVAGKLKIGAKPIDLVTVVREAIDVVRPSADAKGIAIQLEAPDTGVTIVGDPERLRQVAWNLLSNAVKFTDCDGHVRAVVQRAEGEACLCVEDDGRGIAPEFLPVVFERFRQADSSSTRQHGGLGLGLAIVRHIVELHGGRASAESSGVGQGSTFRVSLPVRAVITAVLDKDDPSGAPCCLTSEAMGGLGGRRVLVVDDDQDARELVEAALLEAGAVARSAGSVREGLVALAQFKPEVVVSDIGMPGEDGYAFIRSIRALPPSRGGDVAAVALTAYARADDRTRLLEAGFDDHVAKPVDADELLGIIANLLVIAA